MVEVFYREEGMAPGAVAPYQIKLEGGELIYAHEDEGCHIRAPARRSSRLQGAGCLQGDDDAPPTAPRKRSKHAHEDEDEHQNHKRKQEC